MGLYIRRDGKTHEVSRLTFGGKALNALYMGTRVIWQAIRSCFGSGRWVGSKPWAGNEKWKGSN